jgi:hypothetical protein
MPRPNYTLDLVTLMITGEDHTIWSSSLCNFLHPQLVYLDRNVFQLYIINRRDNFKWATFLNIFIQLFKELCYYQIEIFAPSLHKFALSAIPLHPNPELPKVFVPKRILLISIEESLAETVVIPTLLRWDFTACNSTVNNWSYNLYKNRASRRKWRNALMITTSFRIYFRN